MPVMASSFVARIRQIHHDLHPAERRLAEFLLDFPGELASYSASELAGLANVSNATVTRFIQRLGYSTYDEARRIVRAEKEAGPALYQSAARMRTADTEISAHIENGRDNLHRTFVKLSDVELKAICSALLKARKVWLVGFRSSQAFAIYLRWQLIQVIENVVAIPQGGETLAEHMASVQPTDCVVIFALRRRPRIISKVLAQATRSGAAVLYVSDDTPAWSGRTRPRWSVQCDCSSLGPLYNHVAVAALCHLLATKIIELAGEAGRRRLSAIEVAHEVIAEL
jgi:DNA-binding MurR/RpiR family transcriptional regulator